jgi:hypothetical protein
MWKLVWQWKFHLEEISDQRISIKCILGNFYEAVMRRRVRNFCLTEKQRQTLKVIYSNLCNYTGFGGGTSYRRLVVRKTGFRES